MDLDLPFLPFLPRRRPAAADPTLPLARNATLALRLPRGARIAVGAGRVWLTERGDLDDHFIDAGGQHVVQRAGPVVLQGESALPARIRVTRAEPGPRHDAVAHSPAPKFKKREGSGSAGPEPNTPSGERRR